jgi:cytosine/adenosine deaminase-related metal-dependent hydrolase
VTVQVVSAPWVLTGGATALPDGAVALDGDTVVAVGPRAEVEARHGPGERRDAVLLPALVNAHLHLELSFLGGEVAGGGGLPAWIERFVRARAGAQGRDPGPAIRAGVRALLDAGVAAVGDVANTLATVGALGEAGLCGTVFHEVFGTSERRLAEAIEAGRAARAGMGPPPRGLRVVESPHAIYSTHHPTLVALLRGGPGSLHLAEDRAERDLAATGGGAFAGLMERLGGRAVDLVPRARSAVALVAPHLAAQHLVVHVVDLDDEDVALLRAAGVTAVLCPRSNAFIGTGTPRLDALLDAGVPLALGTDSLASCPSLAPLADAALLRRAFPAIPARRIVPLLWNGAAVGAPHVGALTPGRAPGVLAAPLGGARAGDPFEWLLQSFAPSGQPFAWLARQTPETSA